MVVLAHATGLRQSELLGVRWTDLDLDTRILRFTTQYGRDGILREPKTTAGLRVLTLPQSTIDVLVAHRREQELERAAAVDWEDWGLVIATRTGRPVNHANARRSWSRILRTAGVDHRGIHHLRHAYVTMLAEQGVHERVAQQLAGHADARMTREIYTPRHRADVRGCRHRHLAGRRRHLRVQRRREWVQWVQRSGNWVQEMGP